MHAQKPFKVEDKDIQQIEVEAFSPEGQHPAIITIWFGEDASKAVDLTVGETEELIWRLQDAVHYVRRNTY